MARRACLAIGVATVIPSKDKAARFGYLDGAALAAEAIGEWALKSGFGEDNVRVVHDEPVDEAALPVTQDRVQEAVDALFPNGADTVEHLILAFCGHGLTDGNVGAISWLFSDSLQKKYRVVSDAFYAELQLHGVKRITLITDACREMPKDFDLARLDPVRGISVEGERAAIREFDRFASCQDGQLGYMVSDPNSAAPGKCIFSGVISDVLWGNEPSAIKDGVITTNSFGVCVRARTAERAKAYRLTLEPQCTVDPEIVVLFDAANPPQGMPALQPWPEAGKAAIMGALPADAVDWDKLDTFAGQIGISLTAVPRTSVPILNEMEMLESGTSARTFKTAAPRKQLVRNMVARLNADTVTERRNRAASNVRRGLVQIRPASINGSNVIIAGDVTALWSKPLAELGRKTAARRGFRAPVDDRGTPVLVEMSDGWFIPIVPYDDLYAVVKRAPSGETFQAYGSRYSHRLFEVAVQAIDDFGSGKLDARGVDMLASNLRWQKHQDPILGAICAYLYRAVTDLDSIRRMAYFYAYHRQPVPYDIALLGEMTVRRADNGAFVLEVPKVSAKPGAAEPDLPYFVTRQTPAVEARVGGRCPWIGIGWDYVALAKRQSAELVAEIADYASDIPRSGFTALPKHVGQSLADTWQFSELLVSTRARV